MLKRLFILFSLALSSLASASIVQAPNARVQYDGVDERHAKAIAQTISAARKVYVEELGFDMPDTIVASITAKAGQPTRLFNDGLNRLTLSLPSAGMLDKPSKSGVFNLYGICHELG